LKGEKGGLGRWTFEETREKKGREVNYPPAVWGAKEPPKRGGRTTNDNLTVKRDQKKIQKGHHEKPALKTVENQRGSGATGRWRKRKKSPNS